jgi:hypothetical protein
MNKLNGHQSNGNVSSNGKPTLSPHPNGMTGVSHTDHHHHNPNEMTLKRFTSQTISRGCDTPSVNCSSSANLHTLHLHPGRPLSLNNFDNIRVVGIVAEEGEIYSLAAVRRGDISGDSVRNGGLDSRLGCSVSAAATSSLIAVSASSAGVHGSSSIGNTCQDQREFQRELLHNLKKSNPPIVTVTPQVTSCNSGLMCSSSASSHHSGSKGKIQNGMILRKISCNTFFLFDLFPKSFMLLVLSF